MGKMPRRMKRFYRNKDSENEEYEDYDSEYYGQGRGEDKYNSPISKLPGMDYEDIDKKNENEIKKMEQMNLEEKLALMEVEKFKKEKKRLPNKKEAEGIADNLYEQFKNKDMGELEEENKKRGRRDRGRRNRQNRDKKEEEFEETPINNPIETGDDNIKDLFAGEGKNKKNELDLNLDLDNDLGEDAELSELEDIDAELSELKKITKKKK
jgi:hypothetical protein